MRTSLIAGLLFSVLAASAPAQAYRPFDGTDAAVAEPYDLEIELEPVGYLRVGRQRYIIAPAAVANYGLADRWELVAEAKAVFPVGGDADDDAALADPALAVKTVLREGSLQGPSGPSVASELAVLMPTPDEQGVGASALLILSERWSVASAHLDLEVAYEREHELAGLAGIIVEGPAPWPGRPVVEVFVERTGVTEVSALVGMIWPAADRLSFDFGARLAHAEVLEGELRAGMTFSIPMLRRSDKPSAQRLGRRRAFLDGRER